MVAINGTSEPMSEDRRVDRIKRVLSMVDSLGVLIGICDPQDQPALREEILRRVKNQAAWADGESKRNTL